MRVGAVEWQQGGAAWTRWAGHCRLQPVGPSVQHKETKVKLNQYVF